MEFIGIIVSINPKVSGQSARGLWQKQDVIFEQKENHRKICVTFFNKPQIVDELKIGDEYNVFFNIESREHNGKWYTNLQAWKILDMKGKVIGTKIQPIKLVQNKRVEYTFNEDEINEILMQVVRLCNEDKTINCVRYKQVECDYSEDNIDYEDEILRQLDNEDETINCVQYKQVEYGYSEDNIDYEDEILRRFERQCEEDERRRLLSTGNIFDASEAFGHDAWALNAYLSSKNR